jgi:thymidine phosphorylase
MTDARHVLAGLRRGAPPVPDDLAWFVAALADGRVSDAQAGAFAMGLCHTPLSDDARVALTRAMATSGDTLSWSVSGPVLDKHSTGGIGDCVSLVLAPALAACGACVPMISGRGLGHTGGTLDKLEAIPGVTTELSAARVETVLRAAGCAIVAASARIAPADRRLYAVRDVTATVESLDLITASILSKKLAAGLEALVLDVKLGAGAFMKGRDAAQSLAEALVETANAAGLPTTALLTDMSQPLAPALGNALEVAEVMAVLCEGRGGRLLELTCRLGGVSLVQGGLASDAETGAARIAEAVRSGAAAERFGAMIAAQGGPLGFVESWQRFLPEAPVIREVTSETSGYISAMDGEALGLCVVGLGGGRQVETDVIDPAAGLSDVVSLGDRVARGDVLARVHAAREGQAEAAERAVRAAIALSDTPPAPAPLVHGRVGP